MVWTRGCSPPRALKVKDQTGHLHTFQMFLRDVNHSVGSMLQSSDANYQDSYKVIYYIKH